MSTIIEVVGGKTVEKAAAKAGANIQQQLEARKWMWDTKEVCVAERVILQFFVNGLRELQMCATYINGKRMTDRTITTWLPSGKLRDVYSA